MSKRGNPVSAKRPYLRYASNAVGIAISLALLYWIVRQANLGRMLEILGDVSVPAFVLTVLLGYLAIPLRVVQWQWLLGRPDRVSHLQALRAICVGHVGNFLLPMRGGELVRAFLLAKSCSLPLSRVLVSVVLARVQDIVPIILVVAVFAWLIPLPPGAVERTGEILGIPIPRVSSGDASLMRVLGITAAVVAMILLGCYAASRPILRIASTVANRLPSAWGRPLLETLRNVEGGIGVVGNPGLFWGAQALAAACWIIYTLSPVPLLLAFSLDWKHALLTALSKTAVTTIAHFLPSAPATVGTFHAFCLLSVIAVNPEMEKDAAIAYVFLAHLISAVSPALPGLVFVPASWRDLMEVRRDGMGKQRGQPKPGRVAN